MSVASTDYRDWLCPDLREYWRLKRSPAHHCWVLQGLDAPQQHRFDEREGFVLSHFSGQLTVQAVQQRCEAKWGDRIPPDFVYQLLQKLVNAGVLMSTESPPPDSSPPPTLKLKAGVQWFQQRDGHWILGDPDGLRHLQVSPSDRHIVEHIGQVPLAELPQRCGCQPADVKRLLNLLAQGQMLEGVEPPQPPRRKFTPMRLLYFKKIVGEPRSLAHLPGAVSALAVESSRVAVAQQLFELISSTRIRPTARSRAVGTNPHSDLRLESTAAVWSAFHDGSVPPRISPRLYAQALWGRGVRNGLTIYVPDARRLYQ